MQDNVRCHTSAETKEWFRVNQVKVIDWPSRSPDINPIENLWGWLVRRVSRGGPQFDNIPQLKEAIREAWNEVPPELLRRLIDSVPARLKEVIQANGGSTSY